MQQRKPARQPQRNNGLRRWMAWIGLISFTCLMAIALSQPAQAQFSWPNGLSESPAAQAPPEEVWRFGSMEVIPVYSPLDGQELFRVTSSTVYDRSLAASDDVFPVEQRAEEINARLWRLVGRELDPDTLEVSVARLNNVTVIKAQDDRYTHPIILVSVTEQDADYYGLPIEVLAEDWRTILEQEIREGIRILSSDELLKRAQRSLKVLLGLGLVTTGVVSVKLLLHRRQRSLRQRKQSLLAVAPGQTTTLGGAESESAVPDVAITRQTIRHKLSQIFPLDRRLALYSFLQWLLFWLLILAWYGGGFWILSQIPILMRFSENIAGKPVELLFVWFVMGLTLRLSRYLIDRVTAAWQENHCQTWSDPQRRLLRTSTISGATKGLVSVTIGGIGLLSALNILGVPTGSVLAIGGLVGLAISFGAQSLVKDLVNGCLILAEDQYAVGDVIDLGNVTGQVENLNLRVTQLRSPDGELITVPNSAITTVKNLTRDWSRVNFSLDVAYQSDPQRAIAILREVAQALYADPAWQSQILAPPEVLGIDHLAHSGITLTTWIRTAPGQQWPVGREFRLRVHQALAASGIDIGAPMQTYAAESRPVGLDVSPHLSSSR